MDTNPYPISPEEWKEIMALPVVQESWGLEAGDTPKSLAEFVYGAKFHFVSGSPGFAGDVFILQGDTLTGDPPMVLRREDGKLIAS